MGYLQEAFHRFVERHIMATDPRPEYSWLDRQSLELEPPSEDMPTSA